MLGTACFALASELVGLTDDAAWSMTNACSPSPVASWLLAHGLYVADLHRECTGLCELC